MNCKLGDLAYIVGKTGRTGDEHIGKIVHCVKLVQHWPAAWQVDPPLAGYRGAHDACLRPIGNPSDDDVDVRDVLVPLALVK